MTRIIRITTVQTNENQINLYSVLELSYFETKFQRLSSSQSSRKILGIDIVHSLCIILNCFFLRNKRLNTKTPNTIKKMIIQFTMTYLIDNFVIRGPVFCELYFKDIKFYGKSYPSYLLTSTTIWQIKLDSTLTNPVDYINFNYYRF